MLKDYYAVLGVPRGSSLADIRVAYRKLASRCHPDKVTSESTEEQAEANLRMVELNEAMSILGNVRKRSSYDRELTHATPARRTRPPEARTSSEPHRKETSPPAQASRTPPPETQGPSMEKRVRALRTRLDDLHMVWKTLNLPQWSWSVEGRGNGRPVLIAHQHRDSLEVKDVRSLDKAVDLVLDDRTKMLRQPWLIILLTCGRLFDARKVLSELDVIARRGRGWLKKKPVIVLYDDNAGRILRFGEVPEHDQMKRILNLLLHP